MRETFCAACLTAFFSLLRSANLCKDRTETATTHACVKDANFGISNTETDVPVLKTDRYLKSRITVSVPNMPCSEFCPTIAIKVMLKTVQPKRPDALFSYRCQGSVTSLSGRAFNELLKQIMNAAGYGYCNWSTHSFRRGGTTFAAAAGIPDPLIKAQGDWRSSCSEQNIALDECRRKQYTSTMAQHLQNFTQSAQSGLEFGG